MPKVLPRRNQEHLAKLRKQVSPADLAYYEQRSKGRIPQREEPGWGLEDPVRRKLFRDINACKVTMSFFEVNWNKGFTGRGGKVVHGIYIRQITNDSKVKSVDERMYGRNDLVGPKGETPEDVKIPELPTPQRERGEFFMP